MEQSFKGGTFINRYKITGTLKTISPLHIGNGDMIADEKRLPQSDERKKEKAHLFTTVITGCDKRAYIPGSTLKGNLRSWLTQIFCDLSLACVNTSKRALDLKKFAEELKDKKTKIGEQLKMTEYLFGSTVNAGKLEFWDAPMAAPPNIPAGHSPLAYSRFDSDRGTLIMKSVAIDPVTGTAAKNKLFNYEVVPRGAAFSLTVSGQNLTNAEMGMLLFALDGFNSFIWPVTLGGMGSVGFGRFTFNMKQISYLNGSNYSAWMEGALREGHAGYTKLPLLSEEEQEEYIEKFKSRFISRIKKGECK
ncbi:RAMP superfamily CRISPR-associated protein [Desulfococcaceae bacterium HSG9]|nr:RAMP superfamily CRISPR-associated protein [Desulfococcaceae bacterium HSG9]